MIITYVLHVDTASVTQARGLMDTHMLPPADAPFPLLRCEGRVETRAGKKLRGTPGPPAASDRALRVTGRAGRCPHRDRNQDRDRDGISPPVPEPLLPLARTLGSEPEPLPLRPGVVQRPGAGSPAAARVASAAAPLWTLARLARPFSGLTLFLCPARADAGTAGSEGSGLASRRGLPGAAPPPNAALRPLALPTPAPSGFSQQGN